MNRLTGVLRSERLVLAPIEPVHADSLYAIFSQPDILCHNRWFTQFTPASWRDYIATSSPLRGKELPPEWAILLPEREGQRVIGSCGYYTWSREHAYAELGYSLDPAFWRRGYAHEALAAIIAYAFESMQLNRIESRCGNSNRPSQHLLEKLGFSREGLLRSQIRTASGFEDVALYALLCEDYHCRDYWSLLHEI